ncbi:hypothetical protein BUALT_Bualt01G0116000 [Buddleja alternifolia]|uniref:GRIP/coiled-coil protein n=1 Tax=Buddleja alternifolia TaxID=168488 RepID=A0AAV6YH60_9LAMI|nr:hypothetical protein BUALT_Bualt01G0116000 [Buddleja alternifolia]
MAAMGVDGARRRRADNSSLPQQSSSSSSLSSPSLLTRAVNSVFNFVRFAEFEILFVLFFLVAFLIFKDLTSRPEYNDILVKKPGGPDWWPN